METVFEKNAQTFLKPSIFYIKVTLHRVQELGATYQ